MVDLPVYGITDTITKSAVEDAEALLLLVLPIISVNPILTICGEVQSALATVLCCLFEDRLEKTKD